MNEFNIIEFLTKSVFQNVSDIHLRQGEHPMVRRNGLIEKVDHSILDETNFDNIIQTIMPHRVKMQLDELMDFDFPYEIPEISRFRVNFCREMGNPAFVIRVIPYKIPKCSDLGLPHAIENFTKVSNGIVLVTGPTGSGKSTTIASLIDSINENYQKHIVTVEDPIEFIYTSKKSVITQRQLGHDTTSFPNGVKYALRQDPDVILVGEMRDRETITSALKAAETGHLVLSTLHTTDAVQTVNRIINAFEPHERDSIRHQVANVLRGTVAQKLIKRADNKGRVPAAEILVATPTVKNYILKNELDNVYDLIKAGSFSDMITMNMSLYRLFKANLASKEEILKVSDTPHELEQMIRGAYHGTSSLTGN